LRKAAERTIPRLPARRMSLRSHAYTREAISGTLAMRDIDRNLL